MFSFFSEFGTAQKLASQKFHVIFFAESGYYFQYFQHLFEALVKEPGLSIAYITADKKDPVLQDSRVTAVYLKNTLAGIFPRLQADVMILTMPDLQHFIFKKSRGVKNYVYVFHALVSTHQQYRSHAFDHYDTIFCTGPQQEKELREAEQRYGLPAKTYISYGYPLLAELKQKCAAKKVVENKALIAPSWYKEGILNTCILDLVGELSKQNIEIWIRPHPEFIKRNKKVYAQLVSRMKQNNAIRFDTAPSVYTHLSDAGILVTDRSGIALEYAFATHRPVLFVDTPLKIQNPEVNTFSMLPLENVYRSQVGISVQTSGLSLIGEAIHNLKSSADGYRTSIKTVEQEVVYSPDHWQNGVDYIKSRLTF
ncbi:MAG TPA: CDP-glycerol glycerophosphotransferase family protein [Flavisolibacter sp.]|jgi:YidC/Oxa1 family membrane protein insertase|nr:CDP-glycerol glycerophosphotransferase family protein [Flavisolibacter sp.]